MSDFDRLQRKQRDDAVPSLVQQSRGAPGKATRTSQIAGSNGSAARPGASSVEPVQRRSSSSSQVDPAAEAAALGTFDRGDATGQAVQRKESGAGELVVSSGELTTLGEGSDAQTRFIHWPHTDASGVTLGKGYDIGSRSAARVIEELTAAGMPQDQATRISQGAGLKGQAANRFVQNNKSSVGEIAIEVQRALLATMLVEYTARAKSTATSTTADSKNRNAAGRERREGKAAGTYVMSEAEWDGMHPAMHEFLTDLIYQGGYYGWDRVAKVNAAIKAHNGDHLGQFKAVRELFTNGYMDTYAGVIQEGKGRRGAKGTWYGQEIDYEGGYRRNSIRLAYLNHVIAALEAGKTVRVSSGGDSATAPGGDAPDATTPPPLPPPAPTPAPAPSPGTGPDSGPSAPAPGAGGISHMVQRGESLGILARKFNVSIAAIEEANADKLKTWGSVRGFNAGETITIPQGAPPEPEAPTSTPEPEPEAPASTPQEAEYVVQRGESLGILARKFGVSVDALKTANAAKLQTWGQVQGFFAGETIVVPGASGASPAPSVEPSAAPESSPVPAPRPAPEAGPAPSPAPESSPEASPAPAPSPEASPAPSQPAGNVTSGEIQENVGAGGANKASDVRIVQRNLVNLGYLDAGSAEIQAAGSVEVTAVVSDIPDTIAAIKQYQKFGLGIGSPDGRIDVGGNTWKNMTGRLDMVQEYSSHQIATEPIPAVLSPSQWISQFPSSPATNGEGRGLLESEKAYEGKNNNVCCWDAAQAMVVQAGGALSHEVTSRIPTLLQQDGEANVLEGQAQLGVKYIDRELLSGKPVMIGVDDGRVASYNADATTEHFIVIVGKVVNGGQVAYQFFDPGTRHGSKGYSDNNQLHLGEDSSLTGKSYSGTKDYRLSQVRQNR